MCGDNCTSYCRIAQDACPVEFAADFGTDVAACLTRCNALDAGPKYFVATAETSGDTVACRLLYATRAYDDVSACAAALGAAPCAP